MGKAGPTSTNLNAVQFCYFAALIDGLRLINEKAKEKNIEVVKLDADALIHYVRFKGDKLVSMLPEEPKKELFTSISDPVPVGELQPYIQKPHPECSYSRCHRLSFVKGLCSIHYNRQRLGWNMDGPIREPSWLKRCRTLERGQAVA